VNFSKPIYRIAEAFEILGVSRPLGSKLIHTGELRTYTVGRNRYTTADALRDFTEMRERAASERRRA